MAERRMFAKTIIDSDAFIDMPLSTQALYFHLSMRADDDGFINNPKKIQRMIGASDDDLKVLCMKRFIIPFESGIVVIKHWKIHNYIQKDRYKPTVYTKEKSLIETKDNGAYTECIQDVSKTETQVRLVKDSIVKDSREEDNKGKKRNVFVPPNYEEVLSYAKEKGREDIAKEFFEYFNVGNWIDSKGNKVKNWKQKFITWCSRNEKKKGATNEANSGDNERSDKQKYGIYI